MRELAKFFAFALGATVVLHGSLVAFGLPFSLSPTSLALVLYLLGLATPAVGAVWLSGRIGSRSFVRDLMRPRGSYALYAAAVAVQAGFIAIAYLLSYLAGHAVLPEIRVAGEFWLLALGQVWVVLGEEIGWRGFALPRLLQVCSPRFATLFVAFVWGIWHVPMFFVSGSLQAQEPIWLFAAAIFAWSSVHTALFARARPSIVPNLVFHASANLSLNLVLIPVTAQATLAFAYVSAGLAVWLLLPSSSQVE